MYLVFSCAHSNKTCVCVCVKEKGANQTIVTIFFLFKEKNDEFFFISSNRTCVFHFLHVCVGGVRNKTIEELLSSSHKFNRYKKVMYQEERKPLKVTFIFSFGVEVHNLVIWFCYSLRKCWRFLKAHDNIIVEVHVGKANDEDVIYVKPKGNTIAKWSNVHYKNSWHFKLLINLVILFILTMNSINLIRSPKFLKWNACFY